MSTPFDVYYHVAEVEVVGRLTLRIEFDDETAQVIDFAPVLYGKIFEPLRNQDYFQRVTVNAETGTIEWPNGADFNPVVLHDWLEVRDKVIASRQRQAVLA